MAVSYIFFASRDVMLTRPIMSSGECEWNAVGSSVSIAGIELRFCLQLAFVHTPLSRVFCVS